MKNLFLSLLKILNLHGDITQASMYEDISTIELKTNDGDYVVSVRRIKKDEENNNGN